MTKKKTEPVFVFLQAEGFSQAYNLLVNQPRSPHVETGAAPKGHSLRRLFHQLSPESQRRICEIWDNEVMPMRSKWWDRLEAHGSPEAAPVPRDLVKALSCGDRAFEKVRYIYEDGNDNLVYVLTDLPTVLRRVIVEKQPHWRNIRRTVEEFGPVRKTG